MYGNTSSDYPTNVEDFAYFFYKSYDVTMTGTTFHKDGHWHTLYLPFVLESLEGTPLEGAEFRKMTNSSYTENILSLYYEKHEGTIYYGFPYIYRFAEAGEDIDNPTFERVQLYVTDWNLPRIIGEVKIYGSYDAVTLCSDDRWALYLDEEDSFCSPDKDITLDACSTYIKLKDEMGAYAGTKSLMSTEGDFIRFDLGTDPTGIETLSHEEAAAGEWYDLNGRRLGDKPAMKGVYVRGGKKVIIK